MNNVDVIGLDNIVKYIESTGKTKFTVYRAGQSGANIPVFECLEHNTSGNAIQAFKRWAEVINNNVVYKIVLCDIVEEAEPGSPAKLLKSKNKSGKMECFFAINNPVPSYESNGKPGHVAQSLDIATLRADIVKEITQKQEESEILRELKAMRTEINVLKIAQEEEEDDEDDDELGGLGNPKQMGQIMALIAMLKGGQTPPPQPPVLNGADEQKTNTGAGRTKEEKTANLNKAVKILFKHDKDFDTDLLLLADMAETKPDTFNYLLTMLRSGGL